MKKISFAIVFALMSTSLLAQTGLQLGFRFNPEFTGLLNKNDFDAGKELDFKSHFSYLSLGVGALYNINNNIGIGVDILFSREGQAYKGNFNGVFPDSNAYSYVVATQLFLNNIIVTGDYEALAELNYVKVPLMFSLTSDNTRPIFFTMLLGPEFNFLEGVAQEVDGTDLEYPGTDITPKDLYKSVTVNGLLALGGAYNLTSGLVLSARLRMDYGFDDVEKKDVMASYLGGPPDRFYSTVRKATHNVTAGLMLALDFKL